MPRGCHDGSVTSDRSPVLPAHAARVALVGKRTSVLEPLDRSLRSRGSSSVVLPVGRGSDVDAMAAHLRGERFDVLAFGRAVDDEVRRHLMDAARSRNPRAQRVDGLAPITELLVAQVELAARRAQALTDTDPAVVIEAVPDPAVVVRTVSDDVEVVRYQLSAFLRSRVSPMQVDREGTDAVAFFGRRPSGRGDFVSIRVDGACVGVGDSLGRLPLCQ